MTTTSQQPARTVVKLQSNPSRYHWEVDEWKADDVLHIPNRFQGQRARYGVGFVGPGGTSRRVQSGPILPGPYAYLYALSTVIDQQGGTGAERKRLQAAGLEHDLHEGDVVEVRGFQFVVVFPPGPRHGDPELKLLDGNLDTADQLAAIQGQLRDALAAVATARTRLTGPPANRPDPEQADRFNRDALEAGQLTQRALWKLNAIANTPLWGPPAGDDLLDMDPPEPDQDV